MFLISKDNLLEPAEFKDLELTFLNTCIGIVYGIIIYYSFMIGICANGVYLMTVITLWRATDDFSMLSIQNIDSYLVTLRDTQEKAAQKDPNEGQHVVISELHVKKKDDQFATFLKNYTELKTLASILNESLGEVFLMDPIVVCFRYATALKLIFTSLGWIDRLNNYYQLVQRLATFFLAAEICRKVR